MNGLERMRATVRIDVKGDAKERYLNMCRARHFPVWDVQSDKERRHHHVHEQRGFFGE